MTRSARVRLGAGVVVTSAAAIAIGLYVGVALRRLGHPYELEWLEGGALEHVRRVLHRQTLYPPPSVEFVSYTYPPLYFWVSAAVAKVTGLSFLPLRLVSLVSSLATMGVVGRAVRVETGRWWPGAVVAGIFAAAFRATGAWYDIARVDSLFVVLLVAGLLAAVRAASWRAGLIAGVLVGLAALTKQTAALAAVPVGVYLLVRRPRVGVAFVGSAFALAGGVSLGLNISSHGWYRFSVVDVLVGHPVERSAIVGFWGKDLAAHLWPSLLVLAVGARRLGPRWAPHLCVAGGLVGAAWVSRLHTGGYDNVLIPAFVAVLVLAGIAGARLAESPRACVALAALVLVQLALLAYSPRPQIPTARDRAAGRALVAALRAVPGDVLVMSHPYYGVLAGKAPHAQAGAAIDVLRTHQRRPRRLLSASIAGAVRSQRFDVIVFDPPEDYRAVPRDLQRYYERIPAPALGPAPVTGIRRRPTQWWRRRR